MNEDGLYGDLKKQYEERVKIAKGEFSTLWFLPFELQGYTQISKICQSSLSQLGQQELGRVKVWYGKEQDSWVRRHTQGGTKEELLVLARNNPSILSIYSSSELEHWIVANLDGVIQSLETRIILL